MLQLTVSVATLLLLVYFGSSCMVDAKPTKGFNTTGEYSDHLAEEQRLAVQIITTDGSGESVTATQKHSGHPRGKFDINGAISFDDQYELMQTKLEHEDGPKTKLHPKRIVINLGSLFANDSSSGTNRNSRSSGDTKMIIGFSPESPTSTTVRPTGARHKQGDRLSKSSSQVRSAQSSGSQGAQSMRNAIMDAIREQGGVPTLVVDGKHVAASLQSRQPRFRFMVDAEDDSVPAPIKAQSSHNFATIRDSLSMAAAENEASLRDQVDGLSREVDPHSTALLSTGSRDDDQGAGESDSSGDQANQVEDESASVLRRAPRKFYYDRLDAAGAPSELGEPFDFASRPSDEQDRRQGDADDAGQESAESEQTQDIQAAEEQPSKEGPSAKPETSRLDAKKKPPPADKPLLVAHNSNAISAQQSQPVQRPQQNSQQDVQPVELIQRAPEKAASTAANKRQLQTGPKEHQKQPTKQTPPTKQQVAQKSSRPVASPARVGDSAKSVDERVARILDQLKLYTTKDQLMKVARELDAYPGRESVESDDDHHEVAYQQPSRESASSGQVTSLLSSPARLKPEPDRARNKVPAPLFYNVQLDQGKGEEVDSAGSEMVPADSQLDASEDRDSDSRGGIELLDKFLLRQQRLRAMAPVVAEQQTRQVDNKRDAEDASAQESDPDAESSLEESTASKPTASTGTGDEDVRDYTSNADLVDIMQSNERAYDLDESQSNNNYADNSQASTQLESPSYTRAPDNKGADEVRAVEQSLDELATQEKQVEQAQS